MLSFILICGWLLIIQMFILWCRGKNKKFNFDPIDYASIDKIEFWVMKEEEPPLLYYEKLENAL